MQQTCAKTQHKLNAIVATLKLLPFLFSLSFQCFNLDICRIDMDRTWENYKRKVNHYIELFDQFRQDEEPFTCFVHQPESYRITPSALVELNTTFKDLFLWFVYPVLVAIICCLSMLFVCYWYWPSSKRAKKYPHPRMYKDGGTTTDMDDSDMSPSPSAMGMGPSSSNNSGGWPKAGPADHDTGGSWPMYWRWIRVSYVMEKAFCEKGTSLQSMVVLSWKQKTVWKSMAKFVMNS